MSHILLPLLLMAPAANGPPSYRYTITPKNRIVKRYTARKTPRYRRYVVVSRSSGPRPTVTVKRAQRIVGVHLPTAQPRRSRYARSSQRKNNLVRSARYRHVIHPRVRSASRFRLRR